jgi:hypothetical protein
MVCPCGHMSPCLQRHAPKHTGAPCLAGAHALTLEHEHHSVTPSVCMNKTQVWVSMLCYYICYANEPGDCQRLDQTIQCVQFCAAGAWALTRASDMSISSTALSRPLLALCCTQTQISVMMLQSRQVSQESTYGCIACYSLCVHWGPDHSCWHVHMLREQAPALLLPQ